MGKNIGAIVGAILGVGTVATLGVVSAVTKPDKKSLKRQFKDYIEDSISSDSDIFTNLFKKAGAEVAGAISDVKVQDCGLWTIGTIKINGHEQKFLGVFGQWIPIE